MIAKATLQLWSQEVDWVLVRREPSPWEVRMWVPLGLVVEVREEGWVALWGGGEGVGVESVVEWRGLVERVVGRRGVVVERRDVERWEDVGSGTAISGAYIWGMVSGVR